MQHQQSLTAALRMLGTRALLLAVHDASFPSEPAEQLGRGTPYSTGGRRFAAFAGALGFTGIQLGPQGRTGRGNPSPYDGTAFSRNPLSIAAFQLADDPELRPLVDHRLLESSVATLAAEDHARAHHERAFDARERFLATAYRRFAESRSEPWAQALASRLSTFTQRHAGWLPSDARFDALAARRGTEDFREWTPEAQGAGGVPGTAVEAYALTQYVAHLQHQRFHEWAHRNNLRLYGDLQIGLAAPDVWRLQGLFLKRYRLGAPPSRTNPDGQPWGYPVLDPDGYSCPETGAPGPAVDYLAARAEKVFDEYDGLRIDHPQGLVCPWVYRVDDADAFHAVQHGARLFAAPNLADHPELARYAIPRVDQLSPEPSVSRYDDGWVAELDPQQVERYGVLLSVLTQSAEAHGCDIRDIACEILSTLPYPLARVIARYGLGRFRVTQKMRPEDPTDVYRSDNAKPSDWIMMGTHDTPPIWRLVDRWQRHGEAGDRAAYLARRLVAEPERPGFRRRLAREPGALVHAICADLLLSRAENVVVFWADLLGLREVYNSPGTVSAENWSLRVPPDYRTRYARAAPALAALNLPFAAALALRSPAWAGSSEAAALATRLEGFARERDYFALAG